MIDLLLNLPDDIFQQHLLHYLSLKDIVNIDKICLNKQYRVLLLNKIKYAKLKGDIEHRSSYQYVKWLNIRKIYIHEICLVHNFIQWFPIIMNDYDNENDNFQQFKYITHCKFTHSCVDDKNFILFLNQCPNLSNLDLFSSNKITSNSVINIKNIFKNLTTVSFYGSIIIDNNTIIQITKYCSKLLSLNLACCKRITSISIFAISYHCHLLQDLNLLSCNDINDDCIISLANHCTNLMTLDLYLCSLITDKSIQILSKKCLKLKYLDINSCKHITDDSITILSKNCTSLEYLDIQGCDLTDNSIKSLIKYCIKLKDLRFLNCKNISQELQEIYSTNYAEEKINNNVITYVSDSEFDGWDEERLLLEWYK